MGTSLKTGLFSIAIAVAMTMAGGCSLDGSPRMRLGSYATSTLGTHFIDGNSLGRHNYEDALFENNGIVYTCRGGHIDIAHLRIAADYTRYLHGEIKKEMLHGDDDFSFKLNVEPSKHYVHLTYPSYWKNLSGSDKEKTANELALELSQYFTFTMTTWHEVLTWFGYKSMGVVPEFPSGFSWEDMYSNLVGIRLASQAMQDKDHSFDEAMTLAIKKELETLGVLSSDAAWHAAQKMKGKWWDGMLLVDMRQRNMDIGTVDGLVTPILVPKICKGAAPQSYPAPTLKTFEACGFSMKLEVEPKEFERATILKIVYPDGKGKRVDMAVHLPIIMDYVRNQGIKMGYSVMPPGK